MSDQETLDPPETSRDAELERFTAVGAQGIFRRFALVLVLLEGLMGTALVVYDVHDSTRSTHERLQEIAEDVIRLAVRLRKDQPRATDEQVVAKASHLSGKPIALIDEGGEVAYASDPAIQEYLPRAFPKGVANGGERFIIQEELGPVSGGWIARPFSQGKVLLVVAPRLPAEEGRLLYFTVSAGVLGLGLAISVVAMLLTGNWMVRHPMSQVVQQLTGALARDIERRKLAEKKAVEARLEAEEHLAFLDNLINASNRVGIVATDAAGRIQLLNRGAEVSLGARPTDALGRLTLDDLRAQTERPSLEDASLHSVVQEGEELVVDSDGIKHVIAVNYSSIVDGDGNANGRLMVFIDITERKRLELKLKQKEMQLVQSAKLAGLGEMATGVAHELNQPLNNIALLASRIGRRLDRAAPEAEFLLERLEKIQGQVQRASKIIEQLRTFGRPTEMRVTSFPVRRPLDAVLDLLRQQLVDRRIRLEVDIPDELPNVRADEAQLEQVLINLLNNARDALGELDSSEREPSIRIQAELERPSEDADPRVCLHVEDNGPGMSERVARRVFEPFFSTKEVGRGTGLGLSISYGLVQGFGGSLTVRSQSSEGTVFSMTIPVGEPISEETRT